MTGDAFRVWVRRYEDMIDAQIDGNCVIYPPGHDGLMTAIMNRLVDAQQLRYAAAVVERAQRDFLAEGLKVEK